MVNRLLLRAYRGALHLYPRAFRHDYGDSLVQTVLDQCTFGGRRVAAVLVRELPDVAGSALRMRGENPMARFVLSVVALTAVAVAVLPIGPIAIVPAIVIGVAVFIAARSGPSLDVASGHPARWLMAAAGAIAIAVAIAAIDGGELSEPAWAAMAVALIAGIGLGLTGLGQLVLAARGARPPAAR